MECVLYAGLCFLRLWDKATSDNPAEPRPSALFMLSAPLTMLMEILKRMWRKMQEYVWYSVQIRVYSKYTSESGSQCFEEYVDKVAYGSIHSLPYKWRIQVPSSYGEIGHKKKKGALQNLVTRSEWNSAKVPDSDMEKRGGRGCLRRSNKDECHLDFLPIWACLTLRLTAHALFYHLAASPPHRGRNPYRTLGILWAPSTLWEVERGPWGGRCASGSGREQTTLSLFPPPGIIGRGKIPTAKISASEPNWWNPPLIILVRAGKRNSPLPSPRSG